MLVVPPASGRVSALLALPTPLISHIGDTHVLNYSPIRQCTETGQWFFWFECETQHSQLYPTKESCEEALAAYCEHLDSPTSNL